MPLQGHRALIEPKKGKGERSLPPWGILIFTPQDLRGFISNFPETRKQTHRLFLADVFIGTRANKAFAVAGPLLGAPQAVLVLEKMIALGVRYVVAYGWCGSLQTSVNIGDIVLPRWAISEEGTSRHYPVAGRPAPDPELYNRLFSVLNGAGKYILHEGGVWSTDAPYRETPDKVLKYQKNGLLGVEMEVSALFTVAAYRRVCVSAALVVSDDLSSLSWYHGYRDQRFQQVRRSLPHELIKIITEHD